MARIDEMIKNQKLSKNLKPSYKPWESRFLSVDIPSDEPAEDHQIIEKEVVLQDTKKHETTATEDADCQDTFFYKRIVTGVQKSILIFMISQEKKR